MGTGVRHLPTGRVGVRMTRTGPLNETGHLSSRPYCILRCRLVLKVDVDVVDGTRTFGDGRRPSAVEGSVSPEGVGSRVSFYYVCRLDWSWVSVSVGCLGTRLLFLNNKFQ